MGLNIIMHQEYSKEFIATGSHRSSTTTAWETRQEKLKKKQQQKTQWWNKHLKYLKFFFCNLTCSVSNSGCSYQDIWGQSPIRDPLWSPSHCHLGFLRGTFWWGCWSGSGLRVNPAPVSTIEQVSQRIICEKQWLKPFHEEGNWKAFILPPFLPF